MTDFNIEVTHSCGHTERHTGATASGDTRSMAAHLASRKCSTCCPCCAYCHRTGDREDMLVMQDGSAVFCNAWCRVQALHPTHYSEHNDIAIPGFLRSWEDHSYHNDLCGRSALGLGADYVTIWVNYEKAEDRDDPSCPRFIVEFYPDGEDRGDDGDVLYTGDNAAVAAQWARAAEDVASGAPPDDDIADMVSRIHKLMKSTEVK